MITGLLPEKEAWYRTLHSTPWRGVNAQIFGSHIRNYSIFLKEIGGKLYLFSYFEYTGKNFEGDMGAMAKDATTQRWWKQTDACQSPLPDAAAKGKIWSGMEEVFHCE
ncbi:MAG: L-rhamnose mutarotase [Kiritimatiellaeota bacterium]|nr:L-rhamnose mutarotase [Kiritimatiellota bacterium]